MGQVRQKIFIQHTILAILQSTYQNLLSWWKFDEVLTETEMHSSFETWCKHKIHITTVLATTKMICYESLALLA